MEVVLGGHGFLFGHCQISFHSLCQNGKGHANIVKMCGRPFEDVEEMIVALIIAWNDRIYGNDTVILSRICFLT